VPDSDLVGLISIEMGKSIGLLFFDLKHGLVMSISNEFKYLLSKEKLNNVLLQDLISETISGLTRTFTRIKEGATTEEKISFFGPLINYGFFVNATKPLLQKDLF
jgi:hypothetical protein